MRRNLVTGLAAVGMAGPSGGDRVEFADRVVDARGKEVGRFVSDCVHVNVGPAPESATLFGSCQLTLLLKDGKIVLAGAYDAAEDAGRSLTFAVIGGTGDYRGATGEAVSAFQPDMTAQLTVNLD